MRRRTQGKGRIVIVTVFGTRPQFIKLAVIWRGLEEHFRSILIDSGQHYDFALAGAFHDTTGLRRPDYHLGVGSAPAAAQIARIAETLDARLRRIGPAAVLVFGDTSTTAGGALAAAYRNIPIAHIEAGLRSGDASTSEEKNRIITDHLAHWRFAPTETAMANLRREGIHAGVVGAGDVMYENWRQWDRRSSAETLARFGVEKGEYYYLTCHRAETVDDPARLKRLAAIVRGLNRPTVFAAHPRARKNLIRHGLWDRLRRHRHLILEPPLPYEDSLALIGNAHTVLTDSGGVQREAYWSRTPCLILRDRTEWVELIACGAARLVDLDTSRIQSALRRRKSIHPASDRFFAARFPSRRIVRRLIRDLGSD